MFWGKNKQPAQPPEPDAVVMRLSENLKILKDSHAQLVNEFERLRDRIQKLEASDFVHNRKTYEKHLNELAEGMPDVPIYD